VRRREGAREERLQIELLIAFEIGHALLTAHNPRVSDGILRSKLPYSQLEYCTPIVDRSVVVRLSIILPMVGSINPIAGIVPVTIVVPVASLVLPVMMTMMLLITGLRRSRQHRKP
jgi:hypothetical protein